MADVQQPEEPLRSYSPSPSLSPTVASSSDPNVERSASTVASSTSSCTSISMPDSSNGDASSKRRGYSRPQATIFADSARNRDSVMSLGTIAHLQHYFARTGLLDGKGAQLAKETKDADGIMRLPRPSKALANDPTRSVSNSYGPDAYASSQYAPSEAVSPMPSSPVLHSSAGPATGDPRMLPLPPTVSTYRQKTQYIPPPPNPSVLRRELREALEDAKKVLVEAREEGKTQDGEAKPDSSPSESRPTQGWHEIEGLHILDLVTLAIKAAKNYYTSHEQPSRLYSIRSERRIRSDLYAVLEVLKKVASRNFAGGYRNREIEDILAWISGIGELVTKDEKAAKAEQEKRESWLWLNGNCNGHEREREWVFLKSFEPSGIFLPVWTEPTEDQAPGGFLLALRDGVNLVQLHNELVRNSWRQFGEIKAWHTDTSKPYRAMENLRYWLKAAQLRWDVVLDVDVGGVVRGKDAAAWKGFDAAVLKWSRAVREELTIEWKEHRETPKPEVLSQQIEPSQSGEAALGQGNSSDGQAKENQDAIEHPQQQQQPPPPMPLPQGQQQHEGFESSQ